MGTKILFLRETGQLKTPSIVNGNKVVEAETENESSHDDETEIEVKHEEGETGASQSARKSVGGRPRRKRIKIKSGGIDATMRLEEIEHNSDYTASDELHTASESDGDDIGKRKKVKFP